LLKLFPKANQDLAKLKASFQFGQANECVDYELPKQVWPPTFRAFEERKRFADVLFQPDGIAIPIVVSYAGGDVVPVNLLGIRPGPASSFFTVVIAAQVTSEITEKLDLVELDQ